MLRALTAWLSPGSKESKHQRSGEENSFSSRLCTFPPHGKLLFEGDGPSPCPTNMENGDDQIRSKSPHGWTEDLEEEMAQFVEISLPAMSMDGRVGESNDTRQRTTEEVLPPAPKCWCRLPTNAKMERRRDTDPLNPGRAYWTCSNVGCACNFFEWVEVKVAKQTPSSSSSSSSDKTRGLISEISGPVISSQHIISSLSPRSKGPDTTNGDGTISTASAPKPYRTSAPIPIPQPAGAANSRRRTPSKSAKDEVDSSC
jgi:hypothetical protein